MAGRLQIPSNIVRKSLHTKTLLWISGVILIILVLLYIPSRFILLDSFTALEDKQTHHQIQTVLNSVEHELIGLKAITTDWAQWNDTQQFLQDGNSAYVATYLTEEAYTRHRLSLTLFLNASSELVFVRAYDPSDSMPLVLNPGDISKYMADYRQLADYYWADPNASIAGVLVAPDAPLLFAAVPVYGNDGTLMGTLLFGRFFEMTEAQSLADSSEVVISIQEYTEIQDSDSERHAFETLLDTGGVFTQTLTNDTIAGYALLNDITGQPRMLLSIEVSRDIYHQGLDTIRFFMFTLIASCIGIMIAVAIWTQRNVSAHLTTISSTMRQIGQSGDLEVRVPVSEHAELGSLAESINEMLAGLAESHGEQTRQLDTRTQDLIEERDLLRILIDNLPERLFVKDTQGRFLIANAAVAQRYSLPRAKDIIGKTDFDIHAPEVAQRFFAQEQALMRGEIPLIDQEERRSSINPLGPPGWNWSVKLPLRDREGRIIGLVGIGRDITERKEMEDALRAAHDELEQRVEERTAELSQANVRLQIEITEREQIQTALAASEHAARDFQEKLKVLNEVNLELAQITDLNTLYRRAIELGHSRLGFDRIGLWRLSDDGTDMIGTFGINPEGELRDERNLRNAIANDPYVSALIQQQAQIIVWDDKELQEEWQSIGRGWGAMASLWDGNRTIGWVATDNYLSHQPPPPYQSELLRLYGSSLGHHITHLEIEAALHESEQRYSSLFSGVPAPIYRTTPEGAILAANPALVTLMGYSDLEAMQQTTVHSFYVNAEDRERWRDLTEREGMVHEFEAQIRKADGSIIWIHDTGHVVRHEDGSVAYYEGSLNDITARKQAEADLANVMERLHTHALELATVAEISRQVTTILDIDQLLWTVSDLTKTNFAFYYAQVYLLDEAGKNLNLAAGAGETGRTLVSHKHTIPTRVSRSLVARAARSHEPVVINDVTQSADFLPNVLLPKTQSEVAIPMLIGDKLIGVLDVQADVKDRFSERDINIITTLAAQVAIAIHNARLFTENARRLALIENSTDLIALFDGQTLKPLYINSAGVLMLGLTQPTDFMTHQFHDFYTPDALNALHQTILPFVQHHGFWRGESTLRRANGGEIPIEQTILAIGDDPAHPQTLAMIITDITERKRSEEALRRANRAYHTLSDCSQAMVRATDEPSLLNEICQIIVDTGGYRMAWVGFADRNHPDQMLPVASAGHELSFLEVLFSDERDPVHQPGPMMSVIRENRSIIINDIAADPSYTALRQPALQRGYHSMMALPLVTEGQIMGALGVYASLPDTFDDHEIALLTELASDLAYGITVLRTRIERQQALRQLRENEANLSAVIENTDASIWSVDRDFNVVTLNSAFNQFFRLSYDFDVTPGTPVNVLAADRVDFWQSHYERTLAGDHFRTEIHYEPENASPFDMEMSFSPITSESGEITGVTVFGRDITGRKRYEEQLMRLNEQLTARNDELLALYDIGRTLTATLDVHEIYQLLFQEVAQQRFGARTFFVALYDDAEQTIVYNFAVVDGEELDPAKLSPMPLGVGPYSDTIRTRQPRVVRFSADEGEDSVYGNFLHTRDSGSELYVPLISQNTVVGVISVQHPDQDGFKEADIQLLSTLANQAATAIQNARLFTAEHQQRVYAETLRDIAAVVNKTLDLDNVLETIFDNIQRVVPHDAANILIIEDGKARVLGSSNFEEAGLAKWVQSVTFDVQENGLMRRIYASGQPLIVPDTQAEPNWQTFPEIDWQRSHACAPILREGAVIGFLNVYSRHLDAFSSQHAYYLQAFAIQAGNAIRNAQLFAATQQHAITYEQQAKRLALINRVSARIAQAIRLEDIYEILTYELQAALNVSFAGLVLYEGEHGHLVMDTHPDRTIHRTREIPLHNNPSVAYLRETHSVLTSSDILNDPLFEATWDFLHDRGTRSMMVIPLVVGDDVIGSLGLDSTDTRQFTETEREIAETIVNQAAVAITKAQLFAAEHDQRRLAETLSATADVINRTLELDNVLDLILENIQRVIPYDAANIIFVSGEWIYVARATGYEKYGTTEAMRTLRERIEETVTWRATITTGRPLAVSDTYDNPGWMAKITFNAWIRSTVKAPIRVEDEIIGVLSLDSETPGTYIDEHAERLQAFAFQAANAIRNAQLFASERDQRTFAETLSATANAINHTLDLEKVLDCILENIQRAIPHDAANIAFINGKWIQVVRATGYEKYGTAEAMRALHLKLSETANWRTIVATEKPLAIPDVLDNPDWMNRSSKINPWLRSSVKAPIWVDDEIIGVLSLDSETPGTFAQEHAERLQAFASQAANAIRNAQLFAGERDQRLFAEALRDTAKIINSTLDFDSVLDNILTTIGRVLPHDAANIMLIEDGIARIARGFGYEKYGVDQWVREFEFRVEETPVWNTMLETGQPFAIPYTKDNPDWPRLPEEDWIESTVKAPIQIEGKIIGILHLDSTTPGTFTQHHAERLQAFADQAAIAIQNAQLFTAEHSQRTLAEALRDTANELTGAMDLTDAAQRILKNVGRVIPHDAANIMLFDWETGVARVISSRGYVDQGHPSEKTGMEIPLSFLIDPEMSRPLIIPDTHNDPRWTTLPGDEWIRSYVSAPIRLQHETIGLINLDTKTPNFYSHKHIDQIKVFANQAAIAIQSAQLFEAVQRNVAELERRVMARTEELNQQRRQLQAILDAMSEGVLYDVDFDVKYINQALTQLTGYGQDEFVNYIAVLRNIQQSEEVFSTMMDDLHKKVTRHGIWQLDTRLRRKNGTEFDAALTVTPVRSTDGNVIGTVTVIRDVSQEKALQEQKDRFIANASHELRTPLANIKTRLYLLNHQPSKMERHLTIINQVADNMAELVENLLDVSRFERGVILLHRRDTVLQDLVEEVTSIQQAEAEQKGIAFHVTLHPTPLLVSVDPQRMSQVITNLVANAINYTDTGGTIAVELTLDDSESHRRAVLRVKDTGIGIKAEMVEHVFEPFFRAEEKAAVGTGLGLTIARDIVALHGGEIVVESTEGQGSTFTVTLDVIE